MGLNANKVVSVNEKKISKQEPMDVGSYPVRVVQVIDLGLQPQRPFQGQEKPPKHEIMMTYEFLDEFCVDDEGNEMEDKPRWLSEEFPFNSLQVDLAKSTKRYKALDPDNKFDGDFTQLIGATGIATVVNNEGRGKNAGRVFNNIGSVASMRAKDAAKAPDLVNPGKVFVLDEPDLEVFRSLPEFLQDKIKGNLEFNGSALQAALEGKEPEPEASDGEEPAEGEW